MAKDNSHLRGPMADTPKHLRPRKLPGQERAQATVDAALEAAAHILLAEGYENMSTNMVAERAGISIGSLYQYFPNKDSLIAALIRRQTENEAAFVQQRLMQIKAPTLESALRQVIQAVFDFRQKDEALHQALLDQMHHIPQYPGLIEQARQATEGLKALLLHYSDEIKTNNLDLALHVVGNASFSLTHFGVSPRPAGITGPELCDEIVKLLVNYLKTPNSK